MILRPVKSGVAVRSADDETAGRIHVILGVRIHQISANHRVDDELLHIGAELFGGDIVVMLRGEHHGVDAHRLAADVFHR